MSPPKGKLKMTFTTGDIVGIRTPSMDLIGRKPIIIKLTATPVFSDGAWIVQGLRLFEKTQWGERRWIAMDIRHFEDAQ